MRVYSNEIVFRGHPDKVCDQISASLLQEYLRQDENTRAGIEVCGGKHYILLTGEITSKAQVNNIEVAKKVVDDIGYDSSEWEFIDDIGLQSSDIALGVDMGGAGDQGMMFGYACNDNEYYLPTAQLILQDFVQLYDGLRSSYNVFLPDGKAQITGYYDDDFRLIKIKDFVVSYQNTEEHREMTDKIIKDMVIKVCSDYNIEEPENIIINATGRFKDGGFKADAGLTGRKIVVDTYQGFSHNGGGNLNAKDYTKVDFSATHKARQIAIQLLKEYNLKYCEVQIAYVIGRAEPLSIYADSDKGYIEVDKKYYEECRPEKIIEDLDLLHFDYVKASWLGHFRKDNVYE